MESLPSIRKSTIWLIVGSLGIAAAIYFALARIEERQREVLYWTNQNTIRQIEWIWIANTIGYQHAKLDQVLSAYVHGSETISHDSVMEQFDVYWGSLSSLNVFSGSIFTAMMNGNFLDESEIDLVVTSKNTAVHLKSEALTKLAEIEQQVINVRPGDANFLEQFHQGFKEIVRQTTELQKNTIKLMRVTTVRQESIATDLQKQLSTNNLLLATVAWFLLLFIGQHTVRKTRDNKQLGTLNSKLRHLLEEKSRHAEVLDTLAHTDALSGLLNRVGYHRVLATALEEGVHHGVCFIDIDLFKVINDSAGHAAGDSLIRQFSTELQNICKSMEAQNTLNSDGSNQYFAARYGGDEFVILCKNCDANSFEEFGVKLLETLCPFMFRFDTLEFEVHASIGTYHFRTEGQSENGIMAAADSACYQAKKLGGSRIRHYSADTGAVETRQSDAYMVGLIQRALNNDRFQIHFQPIVALHPAAIASNSYELLIRMFDDNETMIPPGLFLSVAESYGFMPRIDTWVVTHALNWLEKNKLDTLGIDHININLSALSINDEEFIANVVSMIKQHSVSVKDIYFEITESVALQGNALTNLNRLKEIGVGLSLDDFGSGFSSFSYLESLPIDQIKIDGAFIRDLDTNPVHLEFVSAIVKIAKSMNKSVVGEFVENQRTIEILTKLGVDAAQGYHISKPKPLPAFIDSNNVFDIAASTGNKPKLNAA